MALLAAVQMSLILVQAQGRLPTWLKSRHKVFKIDRDFVSLKPNFMRKYNPAEFGPPGFPAQDKSAAQGNPWQQGHQSSSEEQSILYLEEKILNWLAMKDKVTTTDMAEFAYAMYEELVPGKLVPDKVHPVNLPLREYRCYVTVRLLQSCKASLLAIMHRCCRR